MNSYCPKCCAAAAIPGFILWVLTKRGNFEEIEKKERLNNSS